MPNAPLPRLLALPEKQRNDVYQLAIKPTAKRLSEPSSPAALLRQTRAFIAAAQQTGAPPETWMVELWRAAGSSFIVPPLFCFYAMPSNGSGRAKAARALLDAGCSLWARSMRVSLDDGQASLDSPSPEPLANYIARGSDEELRPILLRAALADPLTPKSFIAALRSAYQQEIFGSSLAPGLWCSADQNVAAISSFFCQFEPELLEASARPGWGAAKIILDDALTRSAAKAAAGPFDFPALAASLSPERLARMESVGFLLSCRGGDPEAPALLLEGSAWLKDNPQLACLRLGSDKASLLHLAVASANVPVLDWLEKSGASLFLAAAQDGELPLEWTLRRLPFHLDSPREGFDFGPLGRMIFNGARALGPKAPARFLKAVAKLDNAGPLLQAMEQAALALSTRSPRLASPRSRRSL